MYVSTGDRKTFSNPFDLSAIPIVTREQADAEERKAKLTASAPTLKAPSTGPKKEGPSAGPDANVSGAAGVQKYAPQLLQVPELKDHGALLKSSAVVELTESETEYLVSVVKHIFKEHVVLQFDVTNTLPDTVLEEVSVVSSPSDEDGDVGLEEEFIIPVPKLVTGEPGTVYVSFKRTEADKSYPVTTFTNVLKFTSKEIDPASGEAEEKGYDDEYPIEDLELSGSDYVIPAFAGSFNHVWEQVGGMDKEAVETLQLSSVKSIAGMFTHVHEPCHPLTISRRRGAIGHDSQSPAAGRL